VFPKIFAGALLGFIVVLPVFAELLPYDPRCIDSVEIVVDDQTGGTFFAPITIEKLKRNLKGVQTVEVAQREKQQVVRDLAEERPKYGAVDNDKKSEESKARVLVRTVWKGGIRDLWFTENSTKGSQARRPSLKLSLGYSAKGGPQLKVGGDTCRYQSPPDGTMLPSYPEKTAGSRQNYHDLASFVAHQLIALSDTEGCNLGSDAKAVVIKIMANGKAQPLPGRVELLTYEAEAIEGSRHERINLPMADSNLSRLGQSEVEIFNRPTKVVYRLAHPRDFGEWEVVHEEQVADDYICGIFSPEVKRAEQLILNVPAERLDKASINLQVDSGHAFLQTYPNFAFRVGWYSVGQESVLVTQSSAFVQPLTVGDTSEIELRGDKVYLLPGQYRVVLEWKRDARRPTIEKREFLWHSSAGFNAADAFGLLGPRRIKKLYKSGSKNSNRIMRNYFFEQAITGRFIKWEHWRKDGGARMARGILWHFREMNSLPYLSQFEGMEGVAAELVRALSMILKDPDAEVRADEDTAIDFLSRLDHAPSIFNRSVHLRRAMCRLEDALEVRGEPIPGWMKCD